MNESWLHHHVSQHLSFHQPQPLARGNLRQRWTVSCAQHVSHTATVYLPYAFEYGSLVLVVVAPDLTYLNLYSIQR